MFHTATAEGDHMQATDAADTSTISEDVEPTLLISDVRALWHSALSARVPERPKLRM